jgi:L-threonylcarbamoyladenylate synthase
MEGNLTKALAILKKGGVLIFPTDTVWGIGVSLQRPEAIKKLYQIKKREKDKPTAVLVKDKQMACQLGEINLQAKKLMARYWPGGLTLVVKAKAGLPKEILGPGGTVGLRQPDHQLLLKLLAKLATGLVATSANFSGEAAPLDRKSINQNLIAQASMVLEGEAGAKPPSTVLDTTVTPFKVLRQGEVVL